MSTRTKNKNIHKLSKLTFLKFSTYRLVLFAGFTGIVLFAYIFGPMMWRYYIGTGSAYHYENGTLAVHYLDVGEGDATIIQLPDNKVVMIDSGTEHYYSRIKTYLNTRILAGTNKKIDFVIATHSHDDHIGGFSQLLSDFAVDVVYRPHNQSSSIYDTDILKGEAFGPPANSQTYDNFITDAYTNSNEVYFIEAGTEITGTGYTIYFHTPTANYIKYSLSTKIYQDYNDISPIITLNYKNNYFLFSGDAGTGAENQFRDSSRAILTDETVGFKNLEVYLKVGHHGSNTSTSTNFLEFIHPNKAIISVGARNTYGHPNKFVMERLKNVAKLTDDDIFMTSELGNIVVSTDGETDQMYFAFDNEVDLSLIYIIAAAVIFFICFTDFKIVKLAA